ncbi:hypothetical protein LQ51_25885 [Micromonospora sp. HK10]|nr:hypothetical protein LQ51_25885 [Micromonospora sp. HK10]
MGGVEDTSRTRRAETIISRAFAVGGIAVVALVVIATVGGESAATAAVAAIGGIVAALVRLAAQYLRRPDP